MTAAEGAHEACGYDQIKRSCSRLSGKERRRPNDARTRYARPRHLLCKNFASVVEDALIRFAQARVQRLVRRIGRGIAAGYHERDAALEPFEICARAGGGIEQARGMQQLKGQALEERTRLEHFDGQGNFGQIRALQHLNTDFPDKRSDDGALRG